VGGDLVGTVAASRPGAPFGVGDRVWASGLGRDGRQGSFSEYGFVRAERCYRLPEDVDSALSAAVAHPAATACLAWFVHGGLRSGEIAYLGGGASKVGSSAVAIERRGEARVIASARPADYDPCRETGACAAVGCRDPDLARRLRAAAPQGVDLFWETLGHRDLRLATEAAAPGGRVLLSAVAGERPALLSASSTPETSAFAVLSSAGRRFPSWRSPPGSSARCSSRTS
jgi:NADPH:quinone reductase-like Zn-dependent oxidoreductase